MNLPLIITCIFITIVLIVFPLIVSRKAEEKERNNEWEKIQKYGNEINIKNKKNK